VSPCQKSLQMAVGLFSAHSAGNELIITTPHDTTESEFTPQPAVMSSIKFTDSQAKWNGHINYCVLHVPTAPPKTLFPDVYGRPQSKAAEFPFLGGNYETKRKGLALRSLVRFYTPRLIFNTKGRAQKLTQQTMGKKRRIISSRDGDYN
jgi:hypothetical protein